MKQLLLSSITSLSLLALSTFQPVYALNNAGTVSLTLGGGYDYFSSKRLVKNSGVGFGIAGYNFTDHWGIEALLGFFNTKSRHVNNYDKTVNGTLFAFDAVYHFSPYASLQPYVLAGPGVTGFNPNGTDAHNEANINAAVGADYFFNEIVALRVEARDLFTFNGGKNDILISGGVTFLINT